MIVAEEMNKDLSMATQIIITKCEINSKCKKQQDAYIHANYVWPLR
jgi:hypothetical protein